MDCYHKEKLREAEHKIRDLEAKLEATDKEVMKLLLANEKLEKENSALREECDTLQLSNADHA